jgi:ATP-dependent DNA helicase RecQ
VYRSGQRFGAGHLIEILRGEGGERVRSLGHDRLSTFGVGREYDERQWRSVFRQLLASGLLEADQEGYGTLRLTEASRAVLKGARTVRLREDAAPELRRKGKGKSAAAANGGTLAIGSDERELWDALRALRARLAREHGVPAYVIFHDATLLAMLRERPQSLSALGAISGVGERKLERYGEDFLAELRA